MLKCKRFGELPGMIKNTNKAYWSQSEGLNVYTKEFEMYANRGDIMYFCDIKILISRKTTTV